jgi:hypothetical protein
MRIVHLAIAATAALGVGIAGASAMTDAQPRGSQARTAATAPLLPLSERDLTSTRQMGCTCTFDLRNHTLAQLVGNELMVRTRAGRQVCRVTEGQFQALSSASGSASCGGLRMSLRRTGRVTSYPASDSASGRAALTIRHGRTARTLNGTWGCAC